LLRRRPRATAATVELAPGKWSIAASADGHEPSAVRLVVISGHDARVAVVLGLGGRAVTGTVTDAGGGAIAGARVDAARLDANTNPTRAVAVAFTEAGAMTFQMRIPMSQMKRELRSSRRSMIGSMCSARRSAFPVRRTSARCVATSGVVGRPPRSRHRPATASGTGRRFAQWRDARGEASQSRTAD
jgi:hypothetical protein